METIEAPEWIKSPSILYESTSSSSEEDSTEAPSEPISSEDLLDAEGEWAIVEKNESYDPSQAHMQAREKVDPRRRKKMKELSPHFEPHAKSGRDHNERILMVNADKVQDPPNNEENSGFFSQVKGLFSSSDNDVPIPHPKPSFASKAVIASAPTSKNKIIRPPDLPARKIKAENIQIKTNRNASIDSGVLDAVVSEKKPENSKIYWQAPPPPHSGKSPSAPKALKKAVPPPAATPKTKAKATRVSTETPLARETIKINNKTKTVFGLRSGRHPGKTRLAIDIDDAAEFKTKIDPIRNVLRIKILNTNWKTDPQGKFNNSSLLGSYVVSKQEDDNSLLLEIRLRRSSEILTAELLPPSTTKYHRIMIDLKE
tara:strand:+ start:4964 stop:6076 length:1113 start_codon:yes stop_codon:yes gene_type:complete